MAWVGDILKSPSNFIRNREGNTSLAILLWSRLAIDVWGILNVIARMLCTHRAGSIIAHGFANAKAPTGGGFWATAFLAPVSTSGRPERLG